MSSVGKHDCAKGEEKLLEFDRGINSVIGTSWGINNCADTNENYGNRCSDHCTNNCRPEIVEIDLFF
jgi:hypothetical protein